MNRFAGQLLATQYAETLTDILDEMCTDPDALELFIECYPEMWEQIAERGYECLSLDQTPQAQKLFGFLLEYHPEEAAYHAAYADALCGSKQFHEAGEHYRQTTQLEPSVPDAFFFLAEIQMIEQQPNEAKATLEQMKPLLALEPTHYLAELLPQRIQYAEEAIQNGGAA